MSWILLVGVPINNVAFRTNTSGEFFYGGSALINKEIHRNIHCLSWLHESLKNTKLLFHD